MLFHILLNTTHNICGYINLLTPSHVFSQGITPHAAVKHHIRTPEDGHVNVRNM